MQRTIIVPKDEKLFTIKESDTVRITGEGISGSKIEINIIGPAKLNVTNNVYSSAMLIGGITKEFEIKSTDKGKVEVIMTITSPIPTVESKILKFTFERERPE